MAETAPDSAVRRFGVFEVNLRSGELRKHGMRLRLSGQPFQVLAFLLERAGEAVTREELRSKLWAAETFVDFDHGLNNAVARIREVLDDSATTPRYVETVPRKGYRFIAPVIGPAEAPVLSIPEPALSEPAELLARKRPFARRSLWFAGVAFGVAMAAGFLLYRDATKSGMRSLAVLPLQNLSGDPAQDYLADGMTEEVIGRLAEIRELRVISRTSAMRFKETKLSAPEIASTLHVDALVEGSIIRQGNRVRVHAQLIRGATDEHFWSATYDREIGDVLALESDVARDIADKVRVSVTGEEHTRLAAARRVSPDVYESYAKGLLGPHNTSPELEQRAAYFQEAIRKDPTFAPAYVELARVYIALSTIFTGRSPSEMRPKALAAARKALELDPDLAEAHAVIANIDQRRWHWSEAEAEYKRALELKPGSAAAQTGFSDWLSCQGRMEEALIWARSARDLDPLGDATVSLAFILFQAHHFDESIRELRSFLAVHPDHAFARLFLGFSLIGKGKPEEAIPELERTVSTMQRSPGSIELLATAYAAAGRRAEALKLIGELKDRRKTGYMPAGSLINPYLKLRDYDQAFYWFEQAYAEQSNILQFLRVHPFFDPVRGDARFQDLMRRVGL